MSELNQKEEILEQINFMIKTSPEEFWNISSDAILLFIKSLIIFGIKSNQVKESLNTIKEMWKVLKEEKRILNELTNNIEYINLDDTSNFIDTLDDLNTNTYNYYDSILEEIEITCDTKNKDRILRPRKNFSTLITNNTYSNQIKKIIKQKR